MTFKTDLCKCVPFVSPQVGNAVPPPMAKSIGLEIKKCIESRLADTQDVAQQA